MNFLHVQGCVLAPCSLKEIAVALPSGCALEVLANERQVVLLPRRASAEFKAFFMETQLFGSLHVVNHVATCPEHLRCVVDIFCGQVDNPCLLTALLEVCLGHLTVFGNIHASKELVDVLPLVGEFVA